MNTDTNLLQKNLVEPAPLNLLEDEHEQLNNVPLENMGSTAEKKSMAFFKEVVPEKPQIQKIQAPPSPPSFWQVDYYRDYFDISTETAIKRIIKAAWPFGPDSFVETEHKPDLYVPVWTFITLIIFMSTFGNIVHAIKQAHATSSTRIILDYDPEKVTTTASILLFYLIINPGIFYFTLKCKGANVSPAELLCLYGYSYIPFIPMSLLFALQYPIFQVMVLFGAAGISTYFLYKNLGELCNKFLGDLMAIAKPYMVVCQVIFCCLIYFRIYN